MFKKVCTLTVFAVLLAFGSSAFAQGKKLSYGVKVGGQMTDQTGDIQNTSSKFGFTGGAQLMYSFSESFALAPDLLFTQRGTSVDVAGSSLDQTLNYLQLPILAQYNLPFGGEKVSPNIAAGPYVSYFLSGTNSGGGQEQEIEGGDDIKTLDYGITAEIGANFDVGPGALTTDLRYEAGLADISPAPDNGSDQTLKNTQLIGLQVGYLF